MRQYLQAGLIDSLHFALAPVALGQGEALLTDVDLPALGFSVTEHRPPSTRRILCLQEDRRLNPGFVSVGDFGMRIS
jgi:dihydrofolate reductase